MLSTNNFTMLAQNGDNNYVEQACLAAMSIYATVDNPSICLITNDPVPDKYKMLFDHIVEIPWGDHAENEVWKVSNRWKIYHAIPYEETIVMDTDMLVLSDITDWFKFLSNYDLFYTTNVYTYRGDLITNNYYRRSMTKFNLPNLYCGLHWFKKSDLAHEFYTWLEMITNNWQQFYKAHAGGKVYQNWCSMDISSAIAAKIMNIETIITNNKAKNPSFVHMKSRVQNWQENIGHKWQDRVATYLDDDCNLTIGNYVQTGLFHYTEKDFVTAEIMKKYENKIGI
jgi:hypothetical protein